MSAIYANVSEVPLALAVWLATDTYEYNNDPFTISTTTLMKPLRQIILPNRVPAGEGLVNLADLMNSRMGTAIHDGIEKSWMTNFDPAMKALGYPKGVIERVRINPKPEEVTEGIFPIYLEQRLTRKLGKWTITGKFDFIGEGMVQDFKSTGVFTYQKQINSDKYTQQGSIYRWLDPKIITADRMMIHYIFTDWKAAMSKAANYPPKRFHSQSFDLIGLNETEAYIHRKLQQIEAYWDAPEEDIPQCSDEELWRSEPVYKYYKNPAKTLKATKRFDTRQEALIRLHEDGNVGIIKEVPGEVKACHYCAAKPICSQRQALIASGDLILNS